MNSFSLLTSSHLLPTKLHSSVPRGKTPGRKIFHHWESESGVSDQLPQLSGVPHEGPALVSPQPETSKDETYRLLKTRKKNRGYQDQPCLSRDQDTQWPALQITAAVFTTKDTNGQHSYCILLQISLVSAPQEFVFADSICLSSSPLPLPLLPWQTGTFYQQSANASAATWM